MSRLLQCLILAGMASGLAGCTVCANCDDYAYPAFGGKWERANRYHGRVGSVFEPAEYLPQAEEIPLGELESEQDGMSEEMTDPPAYDDGQDPPPDLPLPENEGGTPQPGGELPDGLQPPDNLPPPGETKPNETAPPTAPPTTG